LGVTEDDENKTQQALITPNSLTNANSQGQSQVQGYEAGSLLLSDNPLNNELKSRFGINMRLSQTVDDLHNIIIPHIVAEKSWSPRVSTSVSRSVGDYITQNAAVEYKLDRHFSVLGSFEQRDYDLYALPGISGTQPTNQQQILGLDLQYQMQFK
jgi:hypothetical protein